MVKKSSKNKMCHVYASVLIMFVLAVIVVLIIVALIYFDKQSSSDNVVVIDDQVDNFVADIPMDNSQADNLVPDLSVQPITPPAVGDNIFSCAVDGDCIPLPSECHPLQCINKNFASQFKKPEMCTEMFALNAAYNPEDCLCLKAVCVDKNNL
jgi:hypothetical protein